MQRAGASGRKTRRHRGTTGRTAGAELSRRRRAKGAPSRATSARRANEPTTPPGRDTTTTRRSTCQPASTGSATRRRRCKPAGDRRDRGDASAAAGMRTKRSFTACPSKTASDSSAGNRQYRGGVLQLDQSWRHRRGLHDRRIGRPERQKPVDDGLHLNHVANMGAGHKAVVA